MRASRIFRAMGSKGKGKTAKAIYQWVQAKDKETAERVAKAFFRETYRCRFVRVIEQQWKDYARDLRMSGCEIGGGL